MERFQIAKLLRVSLITFLALPFCLSCATVSAEAEDPIVGQWDGVGYGSTFHITFTKDHKYRLTDSWANGKAEEFASGPWTRQGEKYALPSKEDNRTGTIDAQGQLIVTADLDSDGPKLFFQRHGAKPAVAAKPAKLPVGEWRYAYTSKSTIPAASPFPFDVMTFAKDKVRLKSSANAKEFNLGYQISGNVISVTTGEAAMPKLEFSFRWEDGDKKLVFAIPQMQHGPFDLEWTFLRPDQFLPYDIKGTWGGGVPVPGMSEEIQMGPDGRFSRTVFSKEGKALHKNNARVSDYYRLWKAPFGNALTIVTFDAEMGTQMTQLFKYEKKQDEIAVTPVELQEDGKLKLHPEAVFTWKLKQGQ